MLLFCCIEVGSAAVKPKGEIMLVDSHCHLNMLKEPTIELLAEAKSNGVGHCLNISVNLKDMPEVLAAAHEFEQVSATVGIHPCTDFDETEPDLSQLLSLADDPAVIGIGETGLDYFHGKGDPLPQQERFRRHIRCARENGKPLIIHCRDAKEDTLRILREEHADSVGGIMHCFVEDMETARRAMDLGFYISFSGIVTFKNATILKEVARQMPLDYMLVETDSPYLAPVPYRGKTNRPAYVRYVAEHIADLREDSLESVALASTANFYRLFNLDRQ